MINDKKILVVVTARKGSKGILGKNYRNLLGKPLFMWSVEAGLNSKYVDNVLLSTNCGDCLEIFHDYALKRDEGMKEDDEYSFPYLSFITRPEKYCTDTSKNEDALIHAMKITTFSGIPNYDIIINLQPTSPCRLDCLLDRCIEAYDAGGYDSLFTAKKDTPFLWKKENGKWTYPVDKNDCCDRKMRQEFEEDEFVYHDDGSVYIIESRILLDKKCRIGYNPTVFENEGLNTLQIDEEFDFELIEKIAETKGITSLI